MKNKLRYIPIQISHLPRLNYLIVGSNLLESFDLSVKSMNSLLRLSLADNRQLIHVPVDLYMTLPIMLALDG